MAHKVKAKPLTFLEIQDYKSKHYKRKEELKKLLLGERTKENAINEQIRKHEINIKSINECMSFVRKFPDRFIQRTQICGWNLHSVVHSAANAVSVRDSRFGPSLA